MRTPPGRTVAHQRREYTTMAEPVIRIAPPVAELIGPENTAAARRPPNRTYKCPRCGGQGSFAQPSSLVVMVADGMPTLVRYAHPACMPSCVQPYAPQSFRVPDSRAMHLTAALLPGRHGYRPAVIAELTGRETIVLPSGDRLDGWMPVLLDLGLSLLASLEAAVPAAPGWSIALPGSCSGIISAPDGSVLYHGELHQFAAWRQAIAATGHAELLSGVIGLGAAAPAGPGAQLQALAEAARAGLLAGGMVPVTVLCRPGPLSA
jgi:hypothetical protein